MNSNFKFNLGDIAKCKITGFKGVIVNRTQWLNSCNVYGLQPQKLANGKVADRDHFDEPQIELVKSSVFEPNQKTGGAAQAVHQINR